MADATALPTGIDPSQIGNLLAAFAPDKKLALNQALFAAGMGLLGMRKGGEMQDAGRAGLLGLGTYNNSMQQQLQQRALELQSAMPLIQLERQQAMLNDFYSRFGLGQQNGQGVAQPTTAGPPQPFMQTGGATGAFNAAIGGTPQPMVSLPTQVPTQSIQQGPSRRDMGLMAAGMRVAGFPDITPALNFAYPNPISIRNAAYFPDSGKLTVIPKAVEGAVANQGPNGAWSTQLIPGALETQGAVEANRNVAKAASTPARDQIVNGTEVNPGGTQFGQMFGNGPLPYGIPSPLTTSAAPSNAAPAPTAQVQSAAQPAAAAATAETAARGGAYQTKLSPTQEETQKDLVEYQKELQSAAATGQQLKARADYLQRLSPFARFGSFSPWRMGAAADAMDAPIIGQGGVLSGVGNFLANQAVPNAGTVVPVLQDWTKQTIKLGSDATRALGPREAAQIWEKTTSAQANPALTQKGAQLVLDSTRSEAQIPMDKLAAFQQYKATTPLDKQSRADFEAKWQQSHPASGFFPNTEEITRVLSGQDPRMNPQSPNVAQQVSGAPVLTAAGQANATVRAYLASGKATPADIAKLRAKGYVQ